VLIVPAWGAGRVLLLHGDEEILANLPCHFVAQSMPRENVARAASWIVAQSFFLNACCLAFIKREV
jgi:hypothetical protein